MNGDEFIRRIAAAILAGRRKSGDSAEPSSATAYATHVADRLPGMLQAGIQIAASMQQLGDGSSITNSFVTTSCLTAASRRG